MSTASPPELQPLPDDLLTDVTRILAPAGWQSADGHRSLLLRPNTSLMTTLRCSFTAGTVTVTSASMTFEDDRPLQIYVRPQSREAMRGVCEVLARHADGLDRLEVDACVAELLAHVESVRYECETSGLVPTVATMQAGTLRLTPRLPGWPEPAAGPIGAPYEGAAAGLADSAARVKLNALRRAGQGDLVWWEAAQYDTWPRLLSNDRRANLHARLEAYEAKGLMKPADASVRTIDGGSHAVWMPGDDDASGTFAHSIGLYYLYNLPEILLVSPMPAAIGATPRALALTVNAIAAAMAAGTRIKPGDRYALVADAVARTVDSACTLDHASLGESRFVLPSRRLDERTLGAASWFYANFMDVLTYPVLACLLRPSRAPSVAAAPAAAGVAEAAVEPVAVAEAAVEPVVVEPVAVEPVAVEAASVETVAEIVTPEAVEVKPEPVAPAKRKPAPDARKRKKRGKTKR